MRHLFRTFFAIVLMTTGAVAQSHESGESTSLFSATPLMDLRTGTYKGFEGGLFENGLDTAPSADVAAGNYFAGEIQPLSPDGLPSATGKIVFASIGMSNAMDEFEAFMQAAQGSSQVNHNNLTIVNGASANMTACYWTVASGTAPCPQSVQNQYDRVLSTVLTPAGVTENQVQVVWILDANPNPAVTGCGANHNLPCQPLCDPQTAGCSNTAQSTEAVRYEQELGEILRAAKTRWPNLKLAFLASRIYAGYATITLNPEPFAYEYGFSVKWLIQAQITQAQTGVIDPVAGDLNYNNDIAPWVTWGPYTWADGPVSRSDGLIWCDGQASAPCKGEVDFQSDGTHPDMTGAKKVSNLLMNFLLSSSYAANWFPASAEKK